MQTSVCSVSLEESLQQCFTHVCIQPLVSKYGYSYLFTSLCVLLYQLIQSSGVHVYVTSQRMHEVNSCTLAYYNKAVGTISVV